MSKLSPRPSRPPLSLPTLSRPRLSRPSFLRTADAPPSFPIEPEPVPTDRLLIFVPHCDDETLGTGGLVWSARQRGVAVKIVFLTNGDGSRSTQLAENAKKLRRNTFLQLAQMRQEEALAACAQLGVAASDVVFMGYPDRGTGKMWLEHWTPGKLFRSPFTRADRAPYENAYTPLAAYCGQQVWSELRGLMVDFRPTHVYTTHPADTHPDHWASWAYALSALESLRTDPATRDWARETRLLTFLVHRGIWPLPHGYHPKSHIAPPRELIDRGNSERCWTMREVVSEAADAKKRALEKYVSQMAFTPHYLRGFLRRNELFEYIPTITPEPTVTPETKGTAPASTDHRSGKVPLSSRMAKGRGIFLTGFDDAKIRLGLRLRRRAPQRKIQLHLHAFAGEMSHVWRVEIRESGRKGRAETVLARCTDSGRVENWQLVRDTAGLEIIIPRRSLGLGPVKQRDPSAGADHAAGENSIVGDAAPETALLVTAVAHVGLRLLDRTEIGAVRLPAATGENHLLVTPLLIAPSDPRHGRREEPQTLLQQNWTRESV